MSAVTKKFLRQHPRGRMPRGWACLWVALRQWLLGSALANLDILILMALTGEQSRLRMRVQRTNGWAVEIHVSSRLLKDGYGIRRRSLFLPFDRKPPSRQHDGFAGVRDSFSASRCSIFSCQRSILQAVYQFARH